MQTGNHQIPGLIQGLPPPGTRVAVGLSGGVDSAVSALLLKEAGCKVTGLFMKNWEGEGACPAKEDFEQVTRVCDRLGIAYFSHEFVEEYWKEVFEEFISELKLGLTPNPDILCNRQIKFHHFKMLAHKLDSEILATGHYARLSQVRSGQDKEARVSTRLLKGLDPGKDQSYFLAALSEESLSGVCFPIGALEKSEVRRIAKEGGLSVHDRKDSTGICFIGEQKFTPFLAQYIKPNPGPMKTPDGNQVGTHQGLSFYTIGQRKGLGLGGEGEAWFVVGKRVEDNTLIVVRGVEHPLLFSSGLIARNPHFIDPGFLPRLKEMDESSWMTCKAKIRYRQKDVDCQLRYLPKPKEGAQELLEVRFPVAQRAVTPGQWIVFYDQDQCLGGAIIKDSHH